MALKDFGLSEKEAKVYLTLLREGSCTITPLIKKTQFQKGSLYDMLERLMEKGVVSYPGCSKSSTGYSLYVPVRCSSRDSWNFQAY